MINVEHVTKAFPGVTALDAVSLEIRAGEFFGLLGPNGAGKTTLMSLLVGYQSPDAGHILVGGEAMTRDSLQARKNIGLVPQSLALYDDISAEENLLIFGSLYGLSGKNLREKIRSALDSVGLLERRKDRVKVFSGGMKRRLNLIASLLHDPPVILCDEPTVGIDPQSRNAIFEYLETLNREGRTIVYTTHYMEEAERLCSRIAVIDAGKIIALGTLEELLGLLGVQETISVVKTKDTIGAADILREFGDVVDETDQCELTPSPGFRFSEVFAALEQRGVSHRQVEVKRPTLEALFLHLTGRRLRD